MLTERTEKRISERLNGSAEGFLRDTRLFGLNYSISQYKLSDIPFPSIQDWVEQRMPNSHVFSQRGLLNNPQDGNNYMEDFLATIIRKFNAYEARITEQQAEIDTLKTAIKYYRAHPLDKCNEMIEQIMKEDRK